MTKIQDTINILKSQLSKTHPIEDWPAWPGNYPFNVIVVKPRPSLSKNDSERPSYFHYDDGAYLINAARSVPALLKYIEELEKRLNE